MMRAVTLFGLGSSPEGNGQGLFSTTFHRTCRGGRPEVTGFTCLRFDGELNTTLWTPKAPTPPKAFSAEAPQETGAPTEPNAMGTTCAPTESTVETGAIVP